MKAVDSRFSTLSASNIPNSDSDELSQALSKVQVPETVSFQLDKQKLRVESMSSLLGSNPVQPNVDKCYNSPGPKSE